MSAVSKEVLNQWAATGFDERAVAGFGTSVEKLIKLSETGQIPWVLPNPQAEMLPYQRKLLAGGGYLYYSYPFLERTKLFIPELTEEIEQALETSSSAQDMIRKCQSYAKYNAWTNCFYQKTGVFYPDWMHVVIMTGVLFPRDFRRFMTNPELSSTPFPEFELSDDESFAGLESLQISLPSLRKILQESLNRRGILICLNEGIFQHKTMRGFEAEDELLIVSKEPLTADVVSGVQFFSNADERALRDWINQQ